MNVRVRDRRWSRGGDGLTALSLGGHWTLLGSPRVGWGGGWGFRSRGCMRLEGCFGQLTQGASHGVRGMVDVG